MGFFRESYSELRHKVTWPSWNSAASSLGFVVRFSILVAITLGIVDWIFLKLLFIVLG